MNVMAQRVDPEIYMYTEPDMIAYVPPFTTPKITCALNALGIL